MSHKDDDHYTVYNSDCSDSEETEEMKDKYVTDTVGIGRHHGDRDKLHKFDILDYDFDIVQFQPGSMNSTHNNVSAIDKDGEIWFLAGFDNQHHKLNMGLEYGNKKEWNRKITRPIRTNFMRKANKFALKIQSSGAFVVAHVRDIITSEESIMLIRGYGEESQSYMQQANKMLKSFNSMTQSILSNLKDQLQILDLKSPCLKEFDSSDWRQAQLHLICRPDFKSLPTALHIEAIPQYESFLDNIDNDQEESKESEAAAGLAENS